VFKGIQKERKQPFYGSSVGMKKTRGMKKQDVITHTCTYIQSESDFISNVYIDSTITLSTIQKELVARGALVEDAIGLFESVCPYSRELASTMPK
jgi:hypothetical protein